MQWALHTMISVSTHQLNILSQGGLAEPLIPVHPIHTCAAVTGAIRGDCAPTMKLSASSGVRGILRLAASSAISRLWAGSPSGCSPACNCHAFTKWMLGTV